MPRALGDGSGLVVKKVKHKVGGRTVTETRLFVRVRYTDPATGTRRAKWRRVANRTEAKAVQQQLAAECRAQILPREPESEVDRLKSENELLKSLFERFSGLSLVDISRQGDLSVTHSDEAAPRGAGRPPAQLDNEKFLAAIDDIIRQSQAERVGKLVTSPELADKLKLKGIHMQDNSVRRKIKRLTGKSYETYLEGVTSGKLAAEGRALKLATGTK